MTTYYYEESTSTKFGKLLGKGARGFKNGFIKFGKLTKQSYNYIKKLNKPGEYYFDDYEYGNSDLKDNDIPQIDNININSSIYWDYEKNINDNQLAITKYNNTDKSSSEDEDEIDKEAEISISSNQEEEEEEEKPKAIVKRSKSKRKKSKKALKMIEYKTHDFLEADTKKEENKLAIAKWKPKEDNFDVFTYVLEEQDQVDNEKTPSITLTENNHSSSEFDNNLMDYVASQQYNNNNSNNNKQWTQF